MINCLYCNNAFEPKNAKAIYCSSKCRTYANRSVKEMKPKDVCFIIGKDNVKRVLNKSALLALLPEFGIKVCDDTVTIPSMVSEKIEPLAVVDEVSVVVPTRTAFTSAADLRHLLDERYNGMFDTNDAKEVIDVVDYKKLFDGCEFPDEYKALWEKIKVDPTMPDKEKNVWKLTLNAK